MGQLRLIVLDVLKPHEPSILKLASTLSDIKGVDGVDITVYEIDSKVENVKITIQGKDVNFSKIKYVIEENGGTIHSIDKVSSGTVLIKEASTHMDNRT
jgi:hypothetical protein